MTWRMSSPLIIRAKQRVRRMSHESFGDRVNRATLYGSGQVGLRKETRCSTFNHGLADTRTIKGEALRWDRTGIRCSMLPPTASISVGEGILV